MKRCLAVLPFLLVGCGDAPAAAAPAQQPLAPIRLTVDARDAAIGRIRSHEVIPAHAGELALVYPKWIPGEHAPNGPIADVASLKVSSNGRALPWRRDPDDMYQIVVAVPAGATSIEVDFDAIRSSSGRFGGSAASSPRFVDVVWNQALLYPKGARASQVIVEPKARLPKGWTWATALGAGVASADGVAFDRVTLERLVDSPLVAGKDVETYDLGNVRGASHALTVVADTPEALVAPDKTVEAWKRLVLEANALFGARHYDSYRFLLVASDNIPWFGLEHHQSSEDYVKERTLVDADLTRAFGDLLPHEYAHSWNGKYRRPKGLATPDYQQPMRGELLWVYEGLTEYLGWVLGARSGLVSFDDAKVLLTRAAVTVDIAGRAWRPLADTAVAAQLLYEASDTGSSIRRNTDFYPEGLLVWLDADVTIRQKTNGARSLDDFCRAFHGGKDTGPEVRPYDLDEIVKTLGAIAPNDWKAFFDERVYKVAPKVPLGGIENGGYRLGWTDKKPEYLGLLEKAFKSQTYNDTLGFTMNEDNVIRDAREGSPAAKAGLTAHMKVIAVDGRKVSSDVISDALARAKKDKKPIAFLTELDGWYRTFDVAYTDGERWAMVERVEGKPDLVSQILAPKAPK